LKDNINRMIGNLKASTRANQEQDWLKTNLARLSGQMQGHRDLKAMASLVISELTPLVSAQHGAFFLVDGESEVLELTAAYGWSPRGGRPARFARGESLVGQVAVEKKTVLVTDVPPGYLEVRSGLGAAPPSNLVILPIVFQGETLGVIELGSFGEFTEVHLDLLDQLKESIG
ncbi:GAF domain-containing protein, partial [Saccharothrix sp. MB29]|nr:GAF domain-containing protein [Saccharothrix sp. MB29]